MLSNIVWIDRVLYSRESSHRQRIMKGILNGSLLPIVYTLTLYIPEKCEFFSITLIRLNLLYNGVIIIYEGAYCKSKKKNEKQGIYAISYFDVDICFNTSINI